MESEWREPGDRAAEVRAEPVIPKDALERSALFQCLSDRLHCDFSAGLWDEVFAGSAWKTVRFEACVMTFVAIQGFPAEWSEQEVAALAERHGGHVEACGPPSALVFFEPRRALEVALLLQRMSKGTLRIALILAPCTVASFVAGGCRRAISLGAKGRIAARLAAKTERGRIQLSAEAHALLATVIEKTAPDAVITTEVHQGVIGSALIALPPPQGQPEMGAGRSVQAQA